MKWTAILVVLFQFRSTLTWANNISEVGHEAVTGNNKFTMDLYMSLSQTEGNIFFSPFSISTCLAILYLMSNGETADEVARTLHVPSRLAVIGQGFHDILQPINKGSVSWANKVFIEKNFKIKPHYVNTIETYLNAELGIENFEKEPTQAHNHIHEWISGKTHGRITELLESGSISEHTKMILVSTMYFKGKWHHSIRPEATRFEPFNYSPNKSKLTEMMTLRGNFGYGDLPSLNIKVLLIPYKDFKQNMIIILPNEMDGLAAVENELVRLDFVQDIMSKIHYTTLEAVIPKFKLEQGYELKSNLHELGIQKVFEAEKSDFSNAVETPGLEVSSVQHKTFIEVNEEGTLASAATGAILSERADIHEVPVFVADRPFLFAITDGETKAVLFFGRFANPT